MVAELPDAATDLKAAHPKQNCGNKTESCNSQRLLSNDIFVSS
jgi:hypothetical protein